MVHLLTPTPALWSDLARIVLISGAMLLWARPHRMGAAAPLWRGFPVKPIARAVEIDRAWSWSPCWQHPVDGGPGRVPYRALRRVKLSRPIHAP